MDKKRKKFSKKQLTALILTIASVAVCIALVITNFFIPVKYLSAYFTLGKKGAREGVMRVRFVDVGYGDCTIIELPDGKNMLIDGGDGDYRHELKLFKFLNKCGIDKIDFMFCTNVNPEHCGGLTDVLKHYEAGTVYMPYCTNSYVNAEYRDFVSAVSASGAERVISEFGVGYSNPDYGYFFTVLSPSPAISESPTSEYNKLNADPSDEDARNNASAVVWLEYAGTSFLFTGDINSDEEQIIMQNYFVQGGFKYGDNAVALEECDVVKVSDHGGKNSSSAEFYDLITPELAVVSVGDNGRGSPSTTALSNVKNRVGENLYLTNDYGTVTIEVNLNGYKVV